jgi:aspartyl-tRNA(Asn)/glutamyl-tRNA(Gln) amidotransferase subunit B
MSQEFEPVIGLEIHAELKTDTKIFCGCSTRFGSEPNSNTCPVCAGFPGALPVLNRKAVDLAIRVGLALHADIPEYNKFDRKNYFYPDLPRAYQISQYDQPICVNGYLTITDERGEAKRIGVTRAHMEEDAGKLVHQGDISSTPFSLVDLNRCGVPLLEIVSEPDMRSAREARAYAEKLRSILLFAGVSDAKMQEGSLRFDANVSVRPQGMETLGTRSETKNLNSFSALEKAIAYEIKRQIELLEDGETVIQETRTWDDARGVTRSMRSKEEAQDYRYFPEPDLPMVHIPRDKIETIRAEMPELPDQAQERLQQVHALSRYDAQMLTATPETLAFFDACMALGAEAKTVLNWIMGDLTRLLKQSGQELDACLITPARLTTMLKLVDSGRISGKLAKTVFEDMFASGEDPERIVNRLGVAQISDAEQLRPVIERALRQNPKAIEDYKRGKQKALGALVGYIMKETKGQANPALLNALLLQRVSEEVTEDGAEH